MKLISLGIRNFKGIGDFGLYPDGQDMNIYGCNEAGKTTIYDAWLWLLFGKDSLDKKDFSIRPAWADAGVETEVEAVIDGNTLKKVYKPVFTKKRGSAKSEFTGNTTDYYINGVPVKQKEYQDYIKSMIDEELFRILTNPRYFNEVMDWKKRRDLLMKICGVAGEDMKGISDKLKVAKAKQTEINRKLKDIPVRIDEATRALPEVQAAETKDVPALRKQLQNLNEKRQSIANSGSVPILQKQIAEASAEILTARNQQREKIQGQIDYIRRQEYQDIQTELIDIESQISQKRRQSSSVLEEMREVERAQAKLKEQHTSISSQEYQEATCPILKESCDRINSDESRSAFNRDKSEELECITNTAKLNKTRHAELKEQDNVLTREINELNAKLPTLQKKEAEYKSKIDLLNGLLRVIDGMPEVTAYIDKKKSLESQLANAKGEVDTSEVDKEIAGIQAEIEQAERIALTIKQREQGLARIEELKEQEKKLAEEYEAQEIEVFNIENDMRTTIENLEGDINGKFNTLNFKLFSQLINGGIEDCCIASSKAGVPYPDMSNSQKIRAGQEVINVVSDHHDIYPPVFIDNSESCDHLLPMKCQVIRLVVSEEDKALRIEPVNKESEVLV